MNGEVWVHWAQSVRSFAARATVVTNCPDAYNEASVGTVPAAPS
ncbi:MAG TPA: hypothetical protein VMB23_06485 [Spirochaetia bacterium]|nr:hypothetical protein [Spirochaetia bacterium]